MNRMQADPKLQTLVNELRVQLATTTEWAFGALFIGNRNGGFGLLFADDMPHEVRVALLEDLQEAIDGEKKSFAQ